MAGVTAAIVIFLDIFHGTPINYSYMNPIYYSCKEYMAGLVLAFYWMTIMPYTRYVGGIQSVDQLVFGAALGLQLAFFCHFIVRDHLISYFEKLIEW